MAGNYAQFDVDVIDVSAFPSNKVWINETLKSHYEQSTFVSLWQSSDKHGTPFVKGRDEIGFFEEQVISVENVPVITWLPEEAGMA